MKLQDFPNGDQLASDDPNREFDCVPTCIADGLTFLLRREFRGDAIKDAVYGRDYVGGTAALAYVDYCAAQGVQLFPIGGDGPALVRAIRDQIARDHPVLATVPDAYAPQHPDWSHVICFYAIDESAPGTLTARDPFGAHDVTCDDATWSKLFRFDQVWVMQLMKGDGAMPVGVPQGWRDDAAKGVLTAPNGFVVEQGFRAWVLSHPWAADNLPLENEQHRDQLELSNPVLGGGSIQRFRKTTLEWTARRGCFEQWTGQEMMELERRLHQITQQGQTVMHPQVRATLQIMQQAVGTLLK